mgnify:CR=1 FL=1
MTNKEVKLRNNGDIAETLVWYIPHADNTQEGIEHTRQALTQARVEAHNTESGYCCACDYDIAVMEEKIDKAREEERERIKKKLKDSLMGYDTRDGYSNIYDEVLEHLVELVEKI